MLAAIEDLLKQTMGLDAASIGSAAVARAVQERLSACELQDAHTYLERVRASQTELQELIEAVVVPETWFFRDPEAFVALARVAREEWLPAHPDGALRVLSLPCSTGEEPYSMAIALEEAGFPPERLRIDAVDISARALRHARRAIYGRNSFRGKEFGFRDRHFEPTPSGYHLGEAVRRPVHFRQGNFFSAGFLSGTEVYDAIFCRNILIYFDHATQRRALGVLTRLLTAPGVLFVGPSETGLLLSHNFVSAKVPMAFAFRKASAVAQPRHTRVAPALALAHPSSRRHASIALEVARPRHAETSAAPRSDRAPAQPTAPRDRLAEAARLADQGRLGEAAEMCAGHLGVHGPSAEAFHLMGLLRDAAGNQAEAGSYYRKALYLDPNHLEALVHLACVLERHGDTKGAQVFRTRARRLERGKPRSHE